MSSLVAAATVSIAVTEIFWKCFYILLLLELFFVAFSWEMLLCGISQ